MYIFFIFKYIKIKYYLYNIYIIKTFLYFFLKIKKIFFELKKMIDLEILKIYSMTQKTLEDIDSIMSMTQGLKFVISYNDPQIHRLMCENMSMRSCVGNELIFDSSKNTNIDFLIYSGKINLYILEKPGLRVRII